MKARQPAEPSALEPAAKPTTPAVAAPARGRLTPTTVLALQRSAGNASVARLLENVLPDGLVDSLKGVQGTVSSAETSAVGEAERRTGAAEAALGEAPRALDGGLAAVEAPHTQAAGAQREQGDATTAKVQADAQALGDDAARQAAQIDGLAPTVPSLLSPARAIVEPAAQAGTAGRLDELAGGDGGRLGAVAAIQAALAAAVQPEWNVDLAEVVATAGGMESPQVGGAVALGERRSGEDRLAQISAFTEQLGGRVSSLAGDLGSGLTGLGGQAAERLQQQAGALTGLTDSATSAVSEGFAAIRNGLTGDVEAAKDQHVAGVDQQAAEARDGIGGVLGQAKSRLSGAAQTAGRLLGGLGSSLLSLLPSSLSGLSGGIGEAQGRIDARQEGLIPKLAGIAKRAKDGIVSAAKAFADSKLRQWVLEERLIQQALAGARKLAEGVGRAVSGLVGDRFGALGGLLPAAAGAELAKLRAAAAGVLAKLRDGACVALAKVGGPYVRQYLPDIGNGINNTISIAASGDLIVPLEEFGIPANLKVAAGASVEVGVLNAVYTVKVRGEAAVLGNLLEGGQVGVGVTDTGPVLSPTQQAFDKLNGSAAPAVAAKVGGAVADAGANAGAATGDGGTRAEVDAGLKGRVSAEWRFNAGDADCTCDGVGGMLTLLSGLGASAALPSPFNSMAGGAVFESFMPNLEICRFSVGGAAGGEVDVKTGGLANLKLRGGVEAMENFELVKGADGKLVSRRTRTLQADLDLTAVAGLTSGSFAKYRAFAGAEGIARLTLSYDKATDEVLPSALAGAVALSFGAKNLDPSLIPTQFGTELAEIERILTGSFPGVDGPREVKVTLTIGRAYEQLEPLGRALKTYFAGPLESVSVDGVMEIVHRHFETLPPTDYVKLTLSQTQRKQIDPHVVVGEGAAAGVEADITAEHTLSKTWKHPAENEVVELASGRARPAAQVVEPEKKKDKDKGKGHKAPTGAADDPIEMLWAKPLKRYARPMRLKGPKGFEEVYTRETRKKLTDKITLGVPSFVGFKNQVFQRGAKTPRTGLEADFMKALDDAGFVVDGELGIDHYSGDHVKDLGFGGRDADDNLWPLEKNTNSEARKWHFNGQKVEFNFATDPPDRAPRRATLAPNAIDDSGTQVGPFYVGLHFKIKDVVDLG